MQVEMSHHLTWWICCVGHECMGPKKNNRDGGHMGHDCMIECYRVYYAMSYGKAIAWLYCRRTCNRTLIASMSITCATTCTAILLFYAMIFQAYIMLMCIRGVCSSERFIRICYWYSSDAQCDYRTPHPFPTPVFHTCIYTFLFVFSRQY